LDDGPEGRLKSLFKHFFKKEDLEDHIQDAREDGEIEGEDMSMLLNVLDLSERTVSKIMIPRTDIVCAEVDTPLSELGELFVKSGHSRIPLYRDNRDSIVGVVHAKDILAPLLRGQDMDSRVDTLMRPPFFVSEYTPIRNVLSDLKGKKTHLAIVLDEYGGTAGLVTLEDVLEEIVGDIRDEYDPETPDEITEQEDGTLKVAGRASLEDIAERTGLPLDSEQVETIGGYLAALAGRIPRQGEYFDIGGARLTVLEANVRHVNWLLIEPRAGNGSLATVQPGGRDGNAE
jgi:magnesium and cobalt transporter